MRTTTSKPPSTTSTKYCPWTGAPPPRGTAPRNAATARARCIWANVTEAFTRSMPRTAPCDALAASNAAVADDTSAAQCSYTARPSSVTESERVVRWSSDGRRALPRARRCGGSRRTSRCPPRGLPPRRTDGERRARRARARGSRRGWASFSWENSMVSSADLSSPWVKPRLFTEGDGP